VGRDFGNEHRVVITGMGLVTPVGIGAPETWEGLLAGRSGLGPITRFDASGYTSRIAGEVKNFDPTNYIPKRETNRLDVFARYAVAAAAEALNASGLPFRPCKKTGAESDPAGAYQPADGDAKRMGVIIGSGIGGLLTIEEQYRRFEKLGPSKISAFTVPMFMPNSACGYIAIRWGLAGPNFAPVSACASGAHAFGEAFRTIQRGNADLIVAGGTEGCISFLGLGGFCSLRALSTRNDEPERASRPFDADRDGFVIAEGSGIAVLESLEHARSRGAKILCEVLGYGLSDDAFHITKPSLDGEGGARTMALAMQDARVGPEDVDYINAHGTSTKLNDATETKSIKTALGEKLARRVPISSTKSHMGHALGAAGGIEFVIAALTTVHAAIPPTLNYEKPDPECDLDYVPNKARKAEVEVALSNSFGFGGHNTCLVVGKLRER